MQWKRIAASVALPVVIGAAAWTLVHHEIDRLTALREQFADEVLLSVSRPLPGPAWFPGGISLPPRYGMRRTGTIDSVRGEITGPEGFVIGFDIGYMAGLHMHERRKAECEWFLEHTMGGQRAFTGVRLVDGRRRIATSTYDQPLTTPANFWADVRDEKDVATFLAIVSTYRPVRRR